MPKSRQRKRPTRPAATVVHGVNNGVQSVNTLGAPAVAVPKRKILIAMPSGNGTPGVETQMSVTNAKIEAEQRGWETVLAQRFHDSILIRARDVLVSMFYYSDCSEMLFWDDDISCGPGVFVKIMEHDVEMVGGIYPSRGGDPPDWVFRPPTDGTLSVSYPSGLMKVPGIATGFMRITRAGIERLLKATPPGHWYTDERYCPGLKVWHLFDFVFDPTQPPELRLRGEDYTFCERFIAAGGTVYADVDLTLGHSGRKTYSGKFGDFLRSGSGQF
jgi:hypothetical protein